MTERGPPPPPAPRPPDPHGANPAAPDAGNDPAWPPRSEGWRHDAPDPPDAFPVPWNVFDGLGLVMWTIIAQVVLAAPLIAIGLDFTGGVAALSVFIAAQLFTFVGAAVYLRARGALSWRLLGPLPPRWRDIPLGIGVGVSGYIIVVVLVVMATQIVGPVEPPQQAVLQESMSGGLVAVLGIISAGILAPILEEFVFRGVLFQSLRAKLGVMPGIGISSFLFAAVHIEVSSLLFSAALLLLAVWLSAALHRTGRLLVAIVGHATFNLITLALALTTGAGA